MPYKAHFYAISHTSLFSIFFDISLYNTVFNLKIKKMKKYFLI